ncbi:hypothetical protein V8F20_007604 [Naviculisporaceae sp. PSN 640]
MRKGVPNLYNYLTLLPFLFASFCIPSCAAIPSTGYLLEKRQPDDPPPEPLEAPISVNALRDPKYLPYQLGGIAASYALCLIIVASLLLALRRRRNFFLAGGELAPADKEFNPFPEPFLLQSEEEYKNALQNFEQNGQQLPPLSPYRNYSLPSNTPLSPTKSHRTARTNRTGDQVPLSARSQASFLTAPSPTTTTISILSAGIDLNVDQTVVRRDRDMAQQQLEDMYKYVMEQEAAKEEGREYQGPPLPSPSTKSTVPNTPITPGRKSKPSNLNLSREEKTQSRGSSILSFLKSPRKNKAPTAVSISSPIMTPMSGTFPRYDEQEMNAIPPRSYAPPPPPPPVPQVPSDLPFRRAGNNLPTPDMSPISTQSIDERIDAALGRPPTRENKAASRRERDDIRNGSHIRDNSATTTGSEDQEPPSATSERSTSGLVGLPTSPKPGVNRFPSLASLPSSPKPGSTFSNRQKTPAPVAVRQGGALPLRAYEPALASPSAASHSTKQTVFTRAAPGPLSPGMQTGMRTPYTGAAVPYTPYQPFSPVVPITPSLVTKADRKRMRRLEPKTPTVEMVRDTEDVW